MNFIETGELLSKIKLLDNRLVDESILSLWQEALDDIDIDKAMAALRVHIRESTAYITPALICQGVERIEYENRPVRPPIRQRQLSPQMQAAYDRVGSSESWSQDADVIGAAITDSPQEGAAIPLPMLRSPDE